MNAQKAGRNITIGTPMVKIVNAMKLQFSSRTTIPSQRAKGFRFANPQNETTHRPMAARLNRMIKRKTKSRPPASRIDRANPHINKIANNK